MKTSAGFQQRERSEPPAPHLPGVGLAEIMAHRLETTVGKALYKLRKETVESVFGIVKEVLGFRRFSMRGKAKANIEWDLVSLSANIKRLHKHGMRFELPRSDRSSLASKLIESLDETEEMTPE